MRPPYNSFNRLPNQVQANAQQSMFPNPSLANPSNMLHNSMQVQSQNQPLFPNVNGMLGNVQGYAMSNMPAPMFQQGFVNAANHLPLAQNNNLGMPRVSSMGPMPQPSHGNVGMASQNVCGMNSVQGYPVQGQFLNPAQNMDQVNLALPLAHFLLQNVPNLAQQLNQGIGLSHGQFGASAFQNMNQHVPVPMTNIPQTFPQGVRPGYHNSFGGPNQPPQVVVPQNPSPFPNPPFGLQHCQLPQINQNFGGMGPKSNDANGIITSPAVQTLQKQTSITSSSTQAQQTNNPQALGFNGPQFQGSSFQTNGGSKQNSFKKNLHQGNFARNTIGSKTRFEKNQFKRTKNEKKNFGTSGRQMGKGFNDRRRQKPSADSFINPAKERKRQPTFAYTEREVQKWREARRRNHPCRAHKEKKLVAKQTDSPAADDEAKTRRQELKEILAKQAELGVEVAEIPAHYLSDADQQEYGRGDKEKQTTTKEKSKKRGRSVEEKKPTLLRRLLQADIRGDQNRLLQVFRFMVMNSFFKDYPDKSLVFPSVVVKDDHDYEDEGDEKFHPAGNEVSEGAIKAPTDKLLNGEDDDNKNSCENGDENGNGNGNFSYDGHVEKGCKRNGRGGIQSPDEEEEEGEIID